MERNTLFPAESTIIVYRSQTNNTKAIAEIIHQKVGGDVLALELENPYPEDYDATVKQVAEENETGFLTPLKTIAVMTKYDAIFLGFPIWGMQLPPSVKSFLHDYELSGKTIIPFNTNAGCGVGSGFKTVEELCPNSIILKGFSIKGGNERDGIHLAIQGGQRKKTEKKVTAWLNEINMLTTKE